MGIAAQPTDRLHDRESTKLGRGLGLTVAALFPAVVWMVIANQAAQIAGYELETLLLVSFGSAVALFIISVCAPAMLRD